jgi:hypothetical protein
MDDGPHVLPLVVVDEVSSSEGTLESFKSLNHGRKQLSLAEGEIFLRPDATFSPWIMNCHVNKMIMQNGHEERNF